MDEAVRLQLGQFDVTLQPGDSQLLDAPVGTYLAPGVHHALLSTGSIPEIWIVEK
jgi:hypothetical protein